SVREGFLRLGDVGIIRNVLVGAAAQAGTVLKRAYQMVAVADYYRAPLPIEVLVSALNVDYNEWRLNVESKGTAWGILYSESSRDGETIIYRTRNAVVTRLLVEMINGGVSGHSG